MNLPVRAIREQIASAVHIVVQLTRFSCGARKVTSISEIVGMEGDIIQMQEVYRFRKTGRDAQERTVGMFEYSGLKPDFLKKLEN
jgi:pilus assembly protein CpaF